MDGTGQVVGGNKVQMVALLIITVKVLEDSESRLAETLAVRNNQVQFSDILNFRAREILGEALIDMTSGKY
jgi:hypothetical protein